MGAVIHKIVTMNAMRFSFLPDQMYLQMKFYDTFGRFMDFDHPRTFNEKLQWLKIHEHNPEYTTMVDKYLVKDYVADRIGAEYIIPTIGVWDRFEDIDFDSLPNQFVLKCTHDSGGLVICKDKASLNIDQARDKINRCLKVNYYYGTREWPYKNVKPRIIAEQYMGDDLRDYKLFCFDSAPRMTMVCSERFTNEGLHCDFYDESWRHLAFKRKYNNADTDIERPEQFELMEKLATELARQTHFSRIDFYEIQDKVYFGEITFYPGSGLERFDPDEWDAIVGDWIKLPGGVRIDAKDATIILAPAKAEQQAGRAIVDYKFFCFDGAADCVMVCTERETGSPKFYFFDKEWNLKKYNIRGKNAPSDFSLPKPDCMDQMFAIAEMLSKGIPYLRVDLYCIDGLIYFGETTFFPDSGLDANILPESDAYWGYKLVLPTDQEGRASC